MQWFDNQKYRQIQTQAFMERLDMEWFSHTLIEFWWKWRWDYHASRVMPGYDPDNKAYILQSLAKKAEIVMTLNTMDILDRPDGRTRKWRIRWDTKLRYNDETLRKINQGNEEFWLWIKKLLLTVFPHDMGTENKNNIDAFINEATKSGIHIHIYKQIADYTNPNNVEKYIPTLITNPYISEWWKNTVLISPGGWSGKFWVILSEICNALNQNLYPNFIKFETFPVFKKPTNHPLNLAFEVATADLDNKTTTIWEYTNYDKDMQNHILLKELYRLYDAKEPYFLTDSPVDFWVNHIEVGIRNEKEIYDACKKEIENRIKRYKDEYAKWIEKISTIQKSQKVLEKFLEWKI